MNELLGILDWLDEGYNSSYAAIAVLVIGLVIVFIVSLLEKKPESKKSYNDEPPQYDLRKEKKEHHTFSPERPAKVQAPPPPPPSKPEVKPEEKPLPTYFSLPTQGLFLRAIHELGAPCVFIVVEETAEGCHFTVISLENSQAWDISSAATNVGKVTREDATSLRTVAPGTAIKHEENGRTYWEITEKAQIEYLR